MKLFSYLCFFGMYCILALEHLQEDYVSRRLDKAGSLSASPGYRNILIDNDQHSCIQIYIPLHRRLHYIELFRKYVSCMRHRPVFCNDIIRDPTVDNPVHQIKCWVGQFGLIHSFHNMLLQNSKIDLTHSKLKQRGLKREFPWPVWRRRFMLPTIPDIPMVSYYELYNIYGDITNYWYGHKRMVKGHADENIYRWVFIMPRGIGLNITLQWMDFPAATKQSRLCMDSVLAFSFDGSLKRLCGKSGGHRIFAEGGTGVVTKVNFIDGYQGFLAVYEAMDNTRIVLNKLNMFSKMEMSGYGLPTYKNRYVLRSWIMNIDTAWFNMLEVVIWINKTAESLVVHDGPGWLSPTLLPRCTTDNCTYYSTASRVFLFNQGTAVNISFRSISVTRMPTQKACVSQIAVNLTWNETFVIKALPRRNVNCFVIGQASITNNGHVVLHIQEFKYERYDAGCMFGGITAYESAGDWPRDSTKLTERWCSGVFNMRIIPSKQILVFHFLNYANYGRSAVEFLVSVTYCHLISDSPCSRTSHSKPTHFLIHKDTRMKGLNVDSGTRFMDAFKENVDHYKGDDLKQVVNRLAMPAGVYTTQEQCYYIQQLRTRVDSVRNPEEILGCHITYTQREGSAGVRLRFHPAYTRGFHVPRLWHKHNVNPMGWEQLHIRYGKINRFSARGKIVNPVHPSEVKPFIGIDLYPRDTYHFYYVETMSLLAVFKAYDPPVFGIDITIHNSHTRILQPAMLGGGHLVDYTWYTEAMKPPVSQEFEMYSLSDSNLVYSAQSLALLNLSSVHRSVVETVWDLYMKITTTNLLSVAYAPNCPLPCVNDTFIFEYFAMDLAWVWKPKGDFTYEISIPSNGAPIRIIILRSPNLQAGCNISHYYDVGCEIFIYRLTVCNKLKKPKCTGMMKICFFISTR